MAAVTDDGQYSIIELFDDPDKEMARSYDLALRAVHFTSPIISAMQKMHHGLGSVANRPPKTRTLIYYLVYSLFSKCTMS